MEGRYAALHRARRQHRGASRSERDPLAEVLRSLSVFNSLFQTPREPRKKGEEGVPLPDFSDLANRRFEDTLPPLHRDLMGSGRTILARDEARLPMLGKVNDLLGRDRTRPTTSYRILQMGIRDACSFHHHRDFTDAKGATEAMVAHYRKAVHFWRRRDRERALYYLGGTLALLQRHIVVQAPTVPRARSTGSCPPEGSADGKRNSRAVVEHPVEGSSMTWLRSAAAAPWSGEARPGGLRKRAPMRHRHRRRALLRQAARETATFLVLFFRDVKFI